MKNLFQRVTALYYGPVAPPLDDNSYVIYETGPRDMYDPFGSSAWDAMVAREEGPRGFLGDPRFSQPLLDRRAAKKAAKRAKKSRGDVEEYYRGYYGPMLGVNPYRFGGPFDYGLHDYGGLQDPYMSDDSSFDGMDAVESKFTALEKSEKWQTLQNEVEHHYDTYAKALRSHNMQAAETAAKLHNEALKKLPKNKWRGHMLLDMGKPKKVKASKSNLDLLRPSNDEIRAVANIFRDGSPINRQLNDLCDD